MRRIIFLPFSLSICLTLPLSPCLSSSALCVNYPGNQSISNWIVWFAFSLIAHSNANYTGVVLSIFFFLCFIFMCLHVLAHAIPSYRTYFDVSFATYWQFCYYFIFLKIVQNQNAYISPYSLAASFTIMHFARRNTQNHARVAMK